MAFVKLQGINELGGSGNIRWGRADLDRAPYRGPQLPLLKEEEAEQLLEKAYDAFYGTFDTSNPLHQQMGHTLQTVIDRSANDWYKILSWQERWVDRDGAAVMYIFVVWIVPFMHPSPAAMKHASNFLPFGT